MFFNHPISLSHVSIVNQNRMWFYKLTFFVGNLCKAMTQTVPSSFSVFFIAKKVTEPVVETANQQATKKQEEEEEPQDSLPEYEPEQTESGTR